MDGTSARKLAEAAGVSIDDLLGILKELQVQITNEDQRVSGKDQLRLLQHLRTLEAESGTHIEFSLEAIERAPDLQRLNQILTAAMSERKIQALIKGNNLQVIATAIARHSQSRDRQLLAAAVLGRLAAVARGRETILYAQIDEIVRDEPQSIDSLPDADAKTYASAMLAHSTRPWIASFSYREALTIDTADSARRELLLASLNREQSASDWIKHITEQAQAVDALQNANPQLRRARRILSTMHEVTERWRGEVGTQIGIRLDRCLSTLLPRRIGEVNDILLFESLDYALRVLRRAIELRFSIALHSDTYAPIAHGKKRLGPGLWARYMQQSSVLSEIRDSLLESAVVLARQNKSDLQIMSILRTVHNTRREVTRAIQRHFRYVRDVDPDVSEWWVSGGKSSVGQKTVEHALGNSEDAQIGALLIETEANADVMDKVGRAVVPLLEISEPILASTTRKAVDGYKNIEQMARRLARMRKLTKTDLKGERLEYNPLEHEMLGGHRDGTRHVLVVRDGIRKEFSGKVKTLVKPWVEVEQ